ncbi:transmembrane protein, putative, partial [Medicago truncatula]
LKTFIDRANSFYNHRLFGSFIHSSPSPPISHSSFQVKEDSKIWKCIVIYLIVYVTSSMACYVMGKRLRRPRLRMRLHAT